MDTLPERMARMETKMETVSNWLAHLDVCVDKLKRTIWQAAGAGTAIIMFVQWLAGKH